MSKADELKSKNENLFERNTILFNENERLKKENEELKADNDARKFAMVMSEKVEKQLRKENEELKTDKQYWEQKANRLTTEWGETLDQRTKAKKLLAKWVELYKPKLEGYPITPIQEQTEQFLKEIEK